MMNTNLILNNFQKHTLFKKAFANNVQKIVLEFVLEKKTTS